MAKRITLQELQDVADPLVSTDDFTALANRAVRRLYTRSATPGVMTEYVFATSPPVMPPPGGNPVSEGVRNVPEHALVLPQDFDHAALFKVKGTIRYVIPLDYTYLPSGYDEGAFVDWGQVESGDRVYGPPADVKQALDNGRITYDEITALCRLAYVDVVNPTDTFPFDNVSVLKLAILATDYEDENDLERAAQYWQLAITELEQESNRYRGPQRTIIPIYDPASEEATYTIN